MLWIFFCGIVIGTMIGRAYGWMKYHYPESQEMIRVKVEAQQLRRLQIQEEKEKIQSRIDASLDRRIRS